MKEKVRKHKLNYKETANLLKDYKV